MPGAHLNPSTWEGETGGSLNLRPAASSRPENPVSKNKQTKTKKINKGKKEKISKWKGEYRTDAEIIGIYL